MGRLAGRVIGADDVVALRAALAAASTPEAFAGTASQIIARAPGSAP